MEEDKQHIDDLITSFLTKELDRKQTKELENWIKESDDNLNYFTNMQEIWFSTLSVDNQMRFDKDKAYNRFLNYINQQSHANKKTRRISFLRIGYAAAVILLLLISSLFSYWYGRNSKAQRFADVTIEVPFGSKAKLYLPDSTLVWLNAGSVLKYSQGFGVQDRTVNLLGEGYFEVTKNKNLAFKVKTKEMDVAVLGTKFNLRNYADDDNVVLSLNEGLVALDNKLEKGDTQKLYPNHKVILNKKTGKQVMLPAQVQQYTGWINGYFFFDEELLPDIVKDLERSYNVKITIEDKELNKFRFYGNFEKKEYSIDEILNILSATKKIKYQMEGKEIKLRMNSVN